MNPSKKVDNHAFWTVDREQFWTKVRGSNVAVPIRILYDRPVTSFTDVADRRLAFIHSKRRIHPAADNVIGLVRLRGVSSEEISETQVFYAQNKVHFRIERIAEEEDPEHRVIARFIRRVLKDASLADI
jgi:hypothetical protein